MISERVPIIFNTPRDNDSINLYFASDMHVGSLYHNDQKWFAFERLLDEPSNYVIFVGDMMENATKNSKSDIYTQTMSPHEQKYWWRDRLQGKQDKIIAIIDGNHEFNRTGKEVDMFPLYDIAVMLGIEDRYRNAYAVADIGVGETVLTRNHVRRQTRYVGAIFHKAQRLVHYGLADATEGIDFLAYGHTHRPIDAPLGKLVYDPHNKKVTERSVEMINAGHFLEYGGYAGQGGMRPTSQKLYKFVLDGKKKSIQTVGFYL